MLLVSTLTQISIIYSKLPSLYNFNIAIYWIEFPKANLYMAALSVLLILSRERTWSGAYLGSRHSASSLLLRSFGCFPSFRCTAPICLLEFPCKGTKVRISLVVVDSLLPGRVLPFRCSFSSHYFFIPPTGGVHVAADEHFVGEVAYPRGYFVN